MSITRGFMMALLLTLGFGMGASAQSVPNSTLISLLTSTSPTATVSSTVTTTGSQPVLSATPVRPLSFITPSCGPRPPRP